jgi:NADP-dependent 3-hydroxy acid dehydrogenase YdfG
MQEILITGAGSGFGEGTSFGLAQKGHSVIAAVQTWSQVTALREKARSLGLETLRVEKLDLLDPYDVAHTLKIKFDILVNHAGWDHRNRADEKASPRRRESAGLACSAAISCDR